MMGGGGVDHRLDPLPEGEVLRDTGEEGLRKMAVGIHKPGRDDRVPAAVDLVVGMPSAEVSPPADRVDGRTDDAHRAILDHLRRGRREDVSPPNQDPPTHQRGGGGVWKS